MARARERDLAQHSQYGTKVQQINKLNQKEEKSMFSSTQEQPALECSPLLWSQPRLGVQKALHREVTQY
jgi:hypothetical protein